MKIHNRTAGAGAMAGLLALLTLQGCAAVGPNYQKPEVQTPDAWTERVAESVARGPESSLQTWWTVFEDPVLDDLIERCRRENLDLKIAVSRVNQSRTILAIARGEKQPVADAGASASVSKLSDDGPLEEVAPPGGFETRGLFQLGIDAVWEIDVFGRVRRSIEAAGAVYEASVEDYRDVLVTLFAEVGLAYTDIRGAQQRIVYARDNAEAQRESLAIAQDLFENGVNSKLDVAQARANLASTRAAIPTFEIALNRALNRLAVLLGQDAGSLQAELAATAPIPTPKEAIGIGVPADVLRQRPDIRRTERLLAAQTAEIGVATAELYPRFGLSGFFGLQSRSLSNLFDASSLTFGLSAPIQWNFLNGGRVRNNISLQDEKANQRLLQYEKKVLQAIEEVENSIVGFNLNRNRRRLLETATDSTAEAVDLVLVQYQTGLTDFNNVLTTQRDLFGQQDQLVATETDVVMNLIALYKALGGGWDLDQTIHSPVVDPPPAENR